MAQERKNLSIVALPTNGENSVEVVASSCEHRSRRQRGVQCFDPTSSMIYPCLEPVFPHHLETTSPITLKRFARYDFSRPFALNLVMVSSAADSQSGYLNSKPAFNNFPGT